MTAIKFKIKFKGWFYFLVSKVSTFLFCNFASLMCVDCFLKAVIYRGFQKSGENLKADKKYKYMHASVRS